jgi:hypothetical protein
MDADRTEQNNLARQHPDRVKEMAAAWEAWYKAAKSPPK